MKKEISINKIDCASLFPRYGYTVEYKKIHGNAGGTMLDGSTTEDVIAIKAVITLTVMPLTEASMTALLSSIYSKDYVQLEYFDTRAGDYRTIEAIYSEMQVKHLFTNVNDDEIWQSEKLTFTER